MRYHFANVDVELEYAGSRPVVLTQRSPLSDLVLQLQYLPLLYAEPEDSILVSGMPCEGYAEQLWNFLELHPKFHLFSEIPKGVEIDTWGASAIVKKWAAEADVIYQMPDWELTVAINSKAFTFNACPKLDGALLLQNAEDLHSWIEKSPFPKVLKSCFGSSGRGHFIIHEINSRSVRDLQRFLQQAHFPKLPLLAEPWLSRLIDFSTQWEMRKGKPPKCLGTTRLVNTPSGEYVSTLVGNEKQILGEYASFLEAHKQEASKLIEQIASQGYFGFAGVDAFVYLGADKKPHLHPIVELNARKTMGLAALLFQQRYFKNQILQLAFCATPPPGSFPLLPKSIWINGTKRIFKRQLAVDLHCVFL